MNRVISRSTRTGITKMSSSTRNEELAAPVRPRLPEVVLLTALIATVTSCTSSDPPNDEATVAEVSAKVLKFDELRRLLSGRKEFFVKPDAAGVPELLQLLDQIVRRNEPPSRYRTKGIEQIQLVRGDEITRVLVYDERVVIDDVHFGLREGESQRIKTLLSEALQSAYKVVPTDRPVIWPGR